MTTEQRFERLLGNIEKASEADLVWLKGVINGFPVREQVGSIEVGGSRHRNGGFLGFFRKVM